MQVGRFPGYPVFRLRMHGGNKYANRTLVAVLKTHRQNIQCQPKTFVHLIDLASQLYALAIHIQRKRCALLQGHQYFVIICIEPFSDR